MYSVIPLAGPDFFSESYGIKPLFPIEGVPLIRKVVCSRSWYVNGELNDDGIIFVLRDTKHADEAESYLRDTFPKCKIVYIPELTRGALLSAVAGFSIIQDLTAPVVVDLVDIIYRSDVSPTKIFNGNANIGGILPFFISDNEKYSYLEIVQGLVRQTAEKKVISNNASAGTYFFRDSVTFFEACTDSVKFDKVYCYKNSLFLCPAFNGIVREGKDVVAVEVDEVEEISLRFHK